MLSFTNFPFGSRVVAWDWWDGSASTCWSLMCRLCPVSHLPSLCILSICLHLDVLTPLMNIKLRLALWGSLTVYGELDLSSSPGENRWSSVHSSETTRLCWTVGPWLPPTGDVDTRQMRKRTICTRNVWQEEVLLTLSMVVFKLLFLLFFI